MPMQQRAVLGRHDRLVQSRGPFYARCPFFADDIPRLVRSVDRLKVKSTRLRENLPHELGGGALIG